LALVSIFIPAPIRNEHGPRQFCTTHWSVVLAARAEGSFEAADALEQLLRVYWMPVYFYIRSRGYEAHDAQDLTQDFFARFLEKNALAAVRREKGRFRSFLLSSLHNFLANAWDRAHAVKRGGRCRFVSLDEESAESSYLRESVADQSAEKLFERRWVVSLLDQALVRLRDECARAGKGALFNRLSPFLAEEPDPGEYAEVAAQLGWKPGAVAVAVHRLRRRYREVIRQEVERTVPSTADIDEEMRELFAAWE
jgi:RNA polymerase sigma factor (sigma-70 family)